MPLDRAQLANVWIITSSTSQNHGYAVSLYILFKKKISPNRVAVSLVERPGLNRLVPSPLGCILCNYKSKPQVLRAHPFGFENLKIF